MSLLEAYNYVREKRHIIKPNPGFFEELIRLELEVHGTSSMNILQYCYEKEMKRMSEALNQMTDA